MESLVKSSPSGPSPSTMSALEDLTAVIQSISRRIHTVVGANHGQLLKQAEQVADIETRLRAVGSRVSELRAQFSGSRGALRLTRSALEAGVTRLEFLQRAARLLAQSARVVAKCRVLEQQVAQMKASGASRDVAKAARTARDITRVLEAPGDPLRGIQCVDSERKFVSDCIARVRSAASARLATSVEALNQTDTGSALQVFFLLGELPSRVDARLDSMLAASALGLKRALDVSSFAGKASAGSAGRTTAGRWRAALWAHFEKFLQNLFAQTVQVWNLQRVLLKKSDPASNTSFFAVYTGAAVAGAAVAEVAVAEAATTAVGDQKAAKASIKSNGASPPSPPPSPPLLDSFWSRMVATIARELKRAFSSSRFVRTIIVSDFPRLQHLFSRLSTRLAQATKGSSSARRFQTVLSRGGDAAEGGMEMGEEDSDTMAAATAPDRYLQRAREAWESSAFGDAQAAALRLVLDGYQAAFLDSTMSKLSEPINVMFGSVRTGRYPTESDAEMFISACANALRSVRASGGDITGLVAARLKQSVKHLSRLAKKTLELKASSTSASDRRNIALFKLLAVVDRGLGPASLRSLIPGIPQVATVQIQDALASCAEVRSLVLSRAFVRLQGEVATRMIRLHDESFARPGLGGSGHKPASRFMSELQIWVERLSRSFTPQYCPARPSPAVRQELRVLLKRVANDVSRVFSRSVTLITGLREDAKLAIANDVAQLESSLHALAPKAHFTAPPRCYAELRHIRRLLFLSNDDVIASLRAGVAEAAALGPPNDSADEDGGTRDPVVAVQLLLSRLTSQCTLPFPCVPHVVLNAGLSKYSRWLAQAPLGTILRKLHIMVQGLLARLDKTGLTGEKAVEAGRVFRAILDNLGRAVTTVAAEPGAAP